MNENDVPKNIDEYIAAAPEGVQPVLRKMRTLIRAAAPDANETIAWGMPTFRGRHNLAHFAAHKAHMGFYPGAEAIVHFQKELTTFTTSKGAIQFPYSRPLPKELIEKIVMFRVEEDKALTP